MKLGSAITFLLLSCWRKTDEIGELATTNPKKEQRALPAMVTGQAVPRKVTPICLDGVQISNEMAIIPILIRKVADD